MNYLILKVSINFLIQYHFLLQIKDNEENEKEIKEKIELSEKIENNTDADTTLTDTIIVSFHINFFFFNNKLFLFQFILMV